MEIHVHFSQHTCHTGQHQPLKPEIKPQLKPHSRQYSKDTDQASNTHHIQCCMMRIKVHSSHHTGWIAVTQDDVLTVQLSLPLLLMSLVSENETLSPFYCCMQTFMSFFVLYQYIGYSLFNFVNGVFTIREADQSQLSQWRLPLMQSYRDTQKNVELPSS